MASGHDIAMGLRAAYWAMHRRTEAGLARSRRARYKHGRYSAEAKARWREAKALMAECEAFIKQLGYNPFSVE